MFSKDLLHMWVSVSTCAPNHLLGCLGSTATRTMGVASKCRAVKGGQAGDVERVADFKMHSSRPPIPRRYKDKSINKTQLT